MPNSCAVKLHRKKQVLAALQSDCSTMVLDLTKDDGGLEVSVAPMIDIEVEMRERDVSRASITNLQGITGKISGSAKISAEYKGAIGTYSAGEISTNANRLLGSLASGDAKLPAIHKYLAASGMGARGVLTAPITSINFNPTTTLQILDNGAPYVPVGAAVKSATMTSATNGTSTASNALIASISATADMLNGYFISPACGVTIPRKITGVVPGTSLTLESGTGVTAVAGTLAFSVAKLLSTPTNIAIPVALNTPPVTNFATTTGSFDITSTSASNAMVGMFVVGSGIPVNTQVVSVIPNVSLKLSLAATATAASVGITFNRFFTCISGSTEIKGAFDASMVGDIITGTNIPGSTSIVSVGVDGTSCILSAAATATAATPVAYTLASGTTIAQLFTASPIRLNTSEQVVLNIVDKSGYIDDGSIGLSLAASGASAINVLTYEVKGVESILAFITNGAAGANYIGYQYSPISSGFKALTIRNEEDGYQRTIYGAMGDVSISVENSDMAKFEFDFKGMLPAGYIAQAVTLTTALNAGDLVKFDVAPPLATDLTLADFVVVQNRAIATSKELWLAVVDGTKDSLALAQAMISGSVICYKLSAGATSWVAVNAAQTVVLRKVSHDDFTQTAGVVYDTSVPPTMKNANLVMDGYRPAFTKVDFKLGNSVTIRQSANTQNGFLAGIINSRKPTISLDPELMNRSDYDYFDKWTKGQTASIEFGVDNGQQYNRFYFFAKKAQYTGGSGNERDGISTIGMDANLVGSSLDVDDEFSLFFY